MRLLKDMINVYLPNVQILCSRINETSTEGDVQTMGQYLASEVQNYIDMYTNFDRLQRLSFIGHSLGGIIIRSAIPFMQRYHGKFHSFITLGTPHIGYRFHSSKLVDAGMWVLKKWKKSLALKQLAMTDDNDPRNTYLYHLSQQSYLSQF